MPRNKETKREVPITFRAHKDTISAIETIAGRQSRTRSGQILHYVLEGLIEDGAEPEYLGLLSGFDVTRSAHRRTP